MAEAVYALCALTSVACAFMLLRGYVRSHTRLLMWCAACFAFLALNNALLFVDKVLFPSDTLTLAGIGFVLWRSVAALCGLTLLIYGLVWDAD